MKNARFRLTKWIILAFSVLLNGFIIVYSSLDTITTNELQRPFTNFFVKIINSFSQKEVKTTPLKSISVSLSNDQYNNVPGYALNEIPLGSAKEINCSFTPSDATNKSIEYSVNPVGSVILNQSGSKVSIVGMKTGVSTITAKSKDGDFTSSVQVNVVETVAPKNYEISLEHSEIVIGTTQTIGFDIDGGVLGHNELVNFRYYDTRKLSYSSNDEAVVKVDEYGVIYPQSIGTTKITVSNGDYSKELNVSVVSGTTPTPYDNLSIGGDSVCYANDMILNQSYGKYKHPLSIKDGDKELNPDDFIWSSSNELLVKVDKHGVMRGFRKSTIDDESAIITAKSKLTGQTATLNVVVKNQLPTKLDYWFKIGDEVYWDVTDATLSVGDVVVIHTSLTPTTQDKAINVISSNPDIISVTSEGDLVNLQVLKEGKCSISMYSVINPDLIVSSNITVVKAGSIGTASIPNVGVYIRKSLGHAAVFMVCQIFTFLTLYMFLYDKKWWLWTSLSLSEGLFISGLSELIQYFVPTRAGTIIDVFIDFGGVVIGALIAFIIVLLIKRSNKKKEDKCITN